MKQRIQRQQKKNKYNQSWLLKTQTKLTKFWLDQPKRAWGREEIKITKIRNEGRGNTIKLTEHISKDYREIL